MMSSAEVTCPQESARVASVIKPDRSRELTVYTWPFWKSLQDDRSGAYN